MAQATKKRRAGSNRGQSRDTSYLVAWRQAFQATPATDFAWTHPSKPRRSLSGHAVKAFIALITHDVYTDCTFARSRDELMETTGLGVAALSDRVSASIASGWIDRQRGNQWVGKSAYRMLRGDLRGVYAYGCDESAGSDSRTSTSDGGGSDSQSAGSDFPGGCSDSRTPNVKDINITLGSGVAAYGGSTYARSHDGDRGGPEHPADEGDNMRPRCPGCSHAGHRPRDMRLAPGETFCHECAPKAQHIATVRGITLPEVAKLNMVQSRGLKDGITVCTRCTGWRESPQLRNGVCERCRDADKLPDQGTDYTALLDNAAL